MKKISIALGALIICLFLCLSSGNTVPLLTDILPYSEAATVKDSGNCGEGVTWTLTSDNVLTISGSGAMYYYAYYVSDIPWYEALDTIEKIVVETGITELCEYAFTRCSAVKSVSLPSTLKVIGESAFSSCESLTSVTIPSNVTTIGESAFNSCESLTSVTIPNKVTTIGNNAFNGCTALTQITLPDSVTSLGEWVFYSCSSLGKVTLSKNLKEIPEATFQDCPKIKEITLPDSITRIGNQAFMGCSQLEKINIPASVRSIGNLALSETAFMNNAKGTLYHDGWLLKYESDVKEVTVKNGTVGIAANSLSSKDITKLTLPSSLKYISTISVAYNKNLSSVSLPSGLVEIGESAFEGCSSLATVSYSGTSLERIDKNAFYDTAFIQKAETAPVYLGEWLLRWNTNATTASVKNGTRKIAYGAFEGCKNLKTVTLPSSVIQIGESCFNECEALTSVTLPSGLKDIPAYTFSGCISLTSLTLPDSLQSIGINAFVSCIRMNLMQIPDTVTSIEEGALGYHWSEINYGSRTRTADFILFGAKNSAAQAYAKENDITFYDKSSLSGSAGEALTWSFDLSTGCLTFTGTGEMKDYSYNNSDWYALRHQIKSVSLPSGLTSIGRHAFCGCDALTEISIPSSVKTIGSYAFSNNSALSKVVLSEGLETISYDAFQYCGKLTSLTLPASLISVSQNVFRYMPALSEIRTAPGSSFTVVDGVLFNADQTTLIFYPPMKKGDTYTVPDSVKTISSGAFRDCMLLQSITLPQDLQTIESNAFRGSSVQALTIPAGITYIERNALDSDALVKVCLLCAPSDCNLSMFTYYNTSYGTPKTIYYSNQQGDWTTVYESFFVPDGTVWINADDSDVTGVSIEETTLSVQAGANKALTIRNNPLTALSYSLSSSDTSVATVSEGGEIFGIKPGAATVTIRSSDGKYTDTCDVTVTESAPVTASVEDFAAAEHIRFNNNTGPYYVNGINGLYIVDNNVLYFYSISDKSTKEVICFSDIKDVFFNSPYIYVLHGSESNIITKYNLQTRESENVVALSEMNGNSLCALDDGRFIVSFTRQGLFYPIGLFAADGSLLSKTDSFTNVYDFYGYDPVSGNFFFEAYYNWRYWGYWHDTHVMKAGNVSKNTLRINDSPMNIGVRGSTGSVADDLQNSLIGNDMMLFQSYVGEHYGNGQMFNGKYVAAVSNMRSAFYFVDARSYDIDEMITSFGIQLSRPQAGSDDDYDYSSMGVRAVYNEKDNTLIAVGNDSSELGIYSISTTEKIASITTAHPVFALFAEDEKIIVLEKEGDEYYIEIIPWKSPSAVSIEAPKTTLPVGESVVLKCITDATIRPLETWTSSDPTIASVLSDGTVLAWHAGTVTIKVALPNGMCASAEITVSPVKTSGSKHVTTSGAISNNASRNNYTTYASPVRSMLYEDSSSHLVRVENTSDNKVLIETYSSEGTKLLSTKTITGPLPLFGGAFHGKDYNYLVFGQNNPNEDDNQEVIRIIQYSKDWKQLRSLSVKGANTYIPFDAGSLRFTEADGKLYIHTCHEMYTSDDGLHHQANMTFVVKQADMSMVQSYYDIMNIAQAGYVSHSFNQLIATDGEFVYRADHGDANPRGMSITRCDVDGSITDVSYIVPVEMQGSHGQNSTGASLGGLELSKNRVLLVGNKSESSVTCSVRNIFLSVATKDLSKHVTNYITNYDEKGTLTACTPHLVKLSDDRFLLIWETYDSATATTKVRAVTVDGDGQITSKEYVLNASLSDCPPILTSDGFVTWYVTRNSAPVIYKINPYEPSTSLPGDVNGDGTVQADDARLALRKAVGLENFETGSYEFIACDVDNNGSITAADARKILRAAVGLEKL